MKSPEQIKGAIRNIAKEKNLRAQEVLQMFLFERILERLSTSSYRDNFILKGGLLISSMIGISERTTMDMDTTVKGIAMSEETISATVQQILSIDVGDGVVFRFKNIEPIREDDDYNNIRISLLAEYGKIRAPIKIDITTGDEITPAAVEYDYALLFEERSIPLMTYTLETILAEKYETVIRRNIGTTRARDFYDLYTLYQMHQEVIRPSILRLAVQKTAKKRGSEAVLSEWESILEDILKDETLHKLWNNYLLETPYVRDLSFPEVVGGVKKVATLINVE